MTVTELIQQLHKLPADLPVYLSDWSQGYASDEPLTVDDGPYVSAAEDRRDGLLPERVVLGGRRPNER
jgi:hypothetical protein